MANTETDVLDDLEQPGLSELREAVANSIARRLPEGGNMSRDAVAGLNSAVTSVPDGLASGLLAGVNPIYGLYACMVGPLVGGLFSSTQLMVVATTSAASLAAGQALAGLPPSARDNALFLMVIAVGVFQIVFGLLRLGRLTRFVSYSVMTGFIMGIAVLTVLSQLPTVAGYEATGANKVAQTLDLILNLQHVSVPSVSIALLTLLLAVWLPRTRLGQMGRLVAVIAPSIAVALLHMEGVRTVADVGTIPSGFPTPHVPSLYGWSLQVLTGAFALSVIILVQGAGVSQSVPIPGGRRASASRDFIAHGAANVASGFFRGLPVGGSLSTTALTVLSGARSRWASIFAGLWMGLIVVVAPGIVSRVAMPALGVLLVIASVATIKPASARSVWNTGWPSRLAIVTTFISTLLLPIQFAVGIGVVLSALLYLNEASTDVSVVQLVERPDGRIEERVAPGMLADGRVTVLDVYGHLFYAGARTLERRLPQPDGNGPVVVLRLRGRASLGATLIEVLSDYADKLNKANGRLYLTGVTAGARDDILRTGKLNVTGPVRVYEATEIIGEATRRAVENAEGWIVNQGEDTPPTGSAPPGAPGKGSRS